MKPPFLTIFSIFSLFLWASGSLPGRSAEPAPLTLEVKGGAVYLKGQEIKGKSPLAAFEAILGKADRVADLANTIYTYDQLGLLLYQTRDQDIINEVVLVISAEDFAFSPKALFHGKLLIGDQVLTGEFSTKQLSSLTTVKFDADSYSPWHSAGNQQRIRLNFNFVEDIGKLQRVAIDWK